MTSTVILSDNGVSSGSAGLKEQGGNDGVLILQTTTSGGTATNAVTIDNLQVVGIMTTPSSYWSSGSAAAIQLGARGSLAYYGGVHDLCLNDAYGNYIVGGVTAARYRTQSGAHRFSSAPSGTAGAAITYTEVMAINKDQTLALQGASLSGGTGITFPAAVNASSDANTLDDYEEGTWSVTDQSGAGLTFVSNTGRYVKIGQMVWASCDFVFPTTASGLNAAINLPFMSYSQSGNAGSTGGGNATYINKGLTTGPIGVYIGNGSTTGVFYRTATNGGRPTNADLSASEIALVFCYPAA